MRLLEFEQVLEGAYQEIVQPACPTPTSETISGFRRYQNAVASLPSSEPEKVRRFADLIVNAFRSGCPALTIVQLTGHADLDPLREQREPGYMMKISRERAHAVKRALVMFINDQAISSRIAWQIRGVGARALVVQKPKTEHERMQNRRVVLFLTTAITPPRPNGVIDPRIDVFAQRALLRLFKGDQGAQADATGMLAAVKGAELTGIYKEDQRSPAMSAKKMNLKWWQLIPAGEDAALAIESTDLMTGRATIVFRDRVRSAPKRLDPALRKAWSTYQLMRMRRLVRCPILSSRGTLARVASLGATPLVIPVSNLVPQIFCQIKSSTPCADTRAQPPIVSGSLTFIVQTVKCRDFNPGPGHVEVDPAEWRDHIQKNAPLQTLWFRTGKPAPNALNPSTPAWGFEAVVVGPVPDWEHGFIQTVENLEWLAGYTGGIGRLSSIANARDVTVQGTRAPWLNETSKPGGPELFGTTTPLFGDEPMTRLPVRHPDLPTARICWVQTKGTFNIWIIAKPVAAAPTNGIVFLHHKRLEFSRRWDLPNPATSNPFNTSDWVCTGTQRLLAEGSGKGRATPVLNTPVANSQLASGFDTILRLPVC